MDIREASLRLRYRRVPVKQEQDEDSDSEEPQLAFRSSDRQVIHSGHFMVSSPHVEHPPKKGYDFDTVNKQTCQTYHFGKASMSHISIDASLTKLFECMTLAYSGKLVSPKWKNFKGLKLLWRDKIRLNNAIWRAWYIQYVEKRQNPVCHFVTPLDGTLDLDVHRSAEAIANEGRCWKRRIEIVIREYHKWRTYFKKRLQKHQDEDLSSLLKDPEEQLSLFGEVSPDMLRLPLYQDEDVALRRVPRKSMESSPAPMEMDPLFDMDVLMSEFSDTLFSTLASHQHIAWPNPREIAHAGNADMIQPGLIPLQPNLGFMETFDPLQDLFHSLRPPAYPSTPPTTSSVPSVPSSISPSQAQLLSSIQLPSDHMPSPNPLLLPSSMASQTGGPGRGETTSDFGSSFLPLYPEQVPSGSQSISSVGPPLTHDLSSSAPLPPPSLDRTVLTEAHAASPGVLANNSSPGSEYSSVSTQQTPSKLPALAPMPSTPVPQTFVLPQPYHPVSANKSRPVKRIAPANALPAQHLILTGPFSSHPSAVIVTPTHLKAEVVPSAGVVIASSPLTSPGFNVVPQTPKSSPVIAPNDNCFSSNNCSKASSSSVHSQSSSPCGLDQVPSPQSSISSSGSPLVKNEQNQSRRTPHISAEQKRRCNINNGFKTLCSLVPTLKSQSNISNAVTLQKTVDHIGKLQQERQQMQEEVRRLKEEIEELNASISLCQEQLPATGVPGTRHRYDHMQEKFNEYVKMRTLQNWKFWVFSIIIKPLFESFNGMVLTTSRAELCQTTLQWLDRHCSLPALRPMVLTTLRHLCTRTSILNEPSLLPDEAIQAVSQTDP